MSFTFKLKRIINLRLIGCSLGLMFILLIFFSGVNEKDKTIIKEVYTYGEGWNPPDFNVFAYGQFTNKKKEGKWEIFLDKKMTKKIGEETYDNGKINGISTYWYPNGNLFVVKQSKNDKLNGAIMLFDTSGNLNFQYYMNDESIFDYTAWESPPRFYFNCDGNQFKCLGFEYDTITKRFNTTK